MTSPEILPVRYEGVSCKTDALLVAHDSIVQFLSIYGAPQATRAIFSAFAAAKWVTIGDSNYIRPQDQAIRYKGFNLGYGKSHGVVYTESLMTATVIVWTAPEERLQRLRQVLSRRRIPYDPKDLPKIEQILKEHDNLIPLQAIVGGISGYRCEFNDNEICDYLVKTIYRKSHQAAA